MLAADETKEGLLQRSGGISTTPGPQPATQHGWDTTKGSKLLCVTARALPQPSRQGAPKLHPAHRGPCTLPGYCSVQLLHAHTQTSGTCVLAQQGRAEGDAPGWLLLQHTPHSVHPHL
jgi:hypothetical protein